MEETLVKGPEGLCASESRLSEGCWGRCGWMRYGGALGAGGGEQVYVA